jgi:nucleoside triphosphate diphosphatase
MSGESLQRLLQIMRRLRDPQHGCPWDREQSYASLAPYTLEESCEVVDALERGSLDDLRDELGDLLFQIVFLAQIATEEGRFDFDDVARSIGEKLVHRHPHVFERDTAPGADDSPAVLRQWETLKAAERGERGLRGELAGIPLALPALVRASKIGKRAARVGFDWPDAKGARSKVDEELAELDRELERDVPDEAAIDDELGDVLFAVVSWARLLGRDPERALRAGNRKFERRFAIMEKLAAERGLDLPTLDAAAWDALWEAAKRVAAPFRTDSSPRS